MTLAFLLAPRRSVKQKRPKKQKKEKQLLLKVQVKYEITSSVWLRGSLRQW